MRNLGAYIFLICEKKPKQQPYNPLTQICDLSNLQKNTGQRPNNPWPQIFQFMEIQKKNHAAAQPFTTSENWRTLPIFMKNHLLPNNLNNINDH